ncbi:MAG: FkbM family methyltransferase [Pelobium sp.]
MIFLIKIKIKTFLLFSFTEFIQIISVSLKLRNRESFHPGIFESRVLFEKLLRLGIVLEKLNDLCIINYTPFNTKFILRRKSSDARVFEQIFLKNEYHDFVQNILMKKGKREIKNIIDCGANVGFASLYLKFWFKTAYFFLFEPDNGNFKIIQENLKINNFQNAHIELAGIWKNDAYLKVKIEENNTREWSIKVEETISEDLNAIKGVSLTSIIENNNLDYIDILKIDIEGSEKHIFEDEELAKKIFSKVRFLAIEIHDDVADRNNIIHFLKSENFEISESGEYTIGFNMGLGFATL